MADNLQPKIVEFNKLVENIKKELRNFSSCLNENEDILNTNFNNWIKVITQKVDEIHKEADEILQKTLTVEDARKIAGDVTKIKKQLVLLKNKQIKNYNDKIDFINTRKEKISKNIEKFPDLVSKLNKINNITKVDVSIGNDWKYLKYTELLDYNKLEEINKQLYNLEGELNIKCDENKYLDSRISSLEQTVEKLKKKSNGRNTKNDINSLLNESISIFDFLIDLEIQTEKNRNTLYKDLFGKYNNRLVEINTKLKETTNRLIEKKTKNDKKNKAYGLLKSQLLILERKYEVLGNKISLYYGKCNEEILARLNGYYNNLSNELEEIRKLYSSSKNKMEENNNKNVETNITFLENIKEKLDAKLNKDPYMLEKDVVFSRIEGTIEKLNKYIKEFNDELKLQGNKIKDRRKIKSLNQKIKYIDLYIDRVRGFLSLYKENEPNNYEILKIKFNESLNKFNGCCKDYNAKRPLLVRNIKNAKNIYKKYQKESLEISGLASVSLLEGNALIPALMHGNIVLGQKMPILNKFTKFVNNILGKIINAKKKDEEWYLSNGAKIGPSIATTSILKNLAVNCKPSKLLISSVKKLTKKMENKASEVKNSVIEKMTDIKDNKIKKVLEEIKKEIEEYSKIYSLSNEEKQKIEEYLMYQRKIVKGGRV